MKAAGQGPHPRNSHPPEEQRRTGASNLARSIAAQNDSRSRGILPCSADADNNVKYALSQEGQYQEAIPHLTETLRINPDYAEALPASLSPSVSLRILL